MPAKFFKILLVLFIIAIAISFVLFWFTNRPSKQLEIFYLDVGQGDAELIKSPGGQNILIDGGPDKTIMTRLSEILPAYDRTIDLMILTHPHDDHVTGQIEVIKNYNVKKILYTGITQTTPNYISWLDAVKNAKIPLVIIDRAQTIKLDSETSLDIIYPRKNLSGRDVIFLNNSSIVALLKYKNFSAIFMGDAEKPVEDELVYAFDNIKAKIIKIGHHGSDTASSDGLIKAVSPETAIIEVGANNKYGLPSLRTIKKLERGNIKVYRTDQNGTIEVISNGDTYQVKASK
jgi:competence protein ComEC